jgi:hypothetical protein
MYVSSRYYPTSNMLLTRTPQISSNQIRCYELSPGTGAQGTYEVAAGSTIGFTAQTSVSHPGPLQFYMAKVPEGKTAANWDGSGDVWFKIYEQGPTISGGQLSWPSNGEFSPPSSLDICMYCSQNLDANCYYRRKQSHRPHPQVPAVGRVPFPR